MYRIWAHITVLLSLALILGGCNAEAAQTKVEGNLNVTLTTDPAPPLAGRMTTLEITVQRDGAPLTDAQVTMTRSMPGMEHPDDDTVFSAESLGQGRYATQTEFVMGGRWAVIVTVTQPGEPDQLLTFSLEVEQP